MTDQNHGLLHALVVTFRRPGELRSSLEALGRQTRRADTLTVVDNDADAEVEQLCAGLDGCSYVPVGGNPGPAGGLAAGVAAIEPHAGQNDWVVFLDDDDPPLRDDLFESLEKARVEALGRGIKVGAVGCAGALYERSKGRLQRPPDDALTGLVDVDYIGGNQLPTYSIAALRAAGGPNAELFFGFDDLDLGLQIKEAGYRLLVPSDVWIQNRVTQGRTGMTPRQASGVRRRSSWRAYYSTRNKIWIARRYCGIGAAMWNTVAAGGTTVMSLYRDRSAGAFPSQLRAVWDAWRGRLGKTVLPG